MSSGAARFSRIGSGHAAFIIAEAGVNHNGDPRLAARLVDAAAAADADAVKFQTFRTGALVTSRAPQAAYQRRTARARSQAAMLQQLELPLSAYRALMARAARRGLMFLSTPFDEESADFLFEIGMPVFKIGSGDLTNLPLLEHVARFGRPMIVSTGMSTLDEVRQAVRAIRRAGDPPLALLHCVSCYPAHMTDLNLLAMQTMARALRLPVGFSDHTLGIAAPLAAAALGASIIEKHLTLDRTMRGPDHRASLEPDAFAGMVQGIRDVEQALGSPVKQPVAAERAVARVARRSLVTTTAIARGARITGSMIACKRPGTGLPPARRREVVGKRATRNLPPDHLLRLSDVG